MQYVAEVLTLIIATSITLVLGAVIGAIVEASKGWASRSVGAKKTERQRRRDGDHIAINTGIGVGLDAGTSSSFRVGIAVAPSVSLGSGFVLDPIVVAEWTGRLSPALASHRQHHDPEELIRYIDDQTVFAVNANGLVDLLMPIEHHAAGEGLTKTFRLDVSSLVRTIVPLVVAVADGGFVRLFHGQLLSSRVDWRFGVSRYINAEAGSVHWSGLDFTGRPPEQDTPGQLPPAGGTSGFGGPSLRNIEVSTPATMIVMLVLQ